MVKHYLMDLEIFDEIGLAPVYALEGCPGWSSDAILVAGQETGDEIKEGALVAYSDHQDVIHVGGISFNKNNIILRGLFPGIPDKILPRKEIKRCDRICTADFRDDALKLQAAELKTFLKDFLGDLCPLQ